MTGETNWPPCFPGYKLHWTVRRNQIFRPDEPHRLFLSDLLVFTVHLILRKIRYSGTFETRHHLCCRNSAGLENLIYCCNVHEEDILATKNCAGLQRVLVYKVLDSRGTTVQSIHWKLAP